MRRAKGGQAITYFRKQTENERRVLAAKLKQGRDEARLSQGEAARLLGIPQSILSELEHCQRRLDVAELIAIAKIYGKQPSWFIDVI